MYPLWTETDPSILFYKIRNQYKGNKIRINLLFEYLNARILFEIRTTPQARSIMSSLNDSTCNINYIELQRNLAIG